MVGVGLGLVVVPAPVRKYFFAPAGGWRPLEYPRIEFPPWVRPSHGVRWYEEGDLGMEAVEIVVPRLEYAIALEGRNTRVVYAAPSFRIRS
jgi:hypothetical protein